MHEIKKSLKDLKLSKMPEIICEPGRSLVAESGSSIIKVNLRKKIAFILMTELMGVYSMLGFQILYFHQE